VNLQLILSLCPIPHPTLPPFGVSRRYTERGASVQAAEGEVQRGEQRIFVVHPKPDKPEPKRVYLTASLHFKMSFLYEVQKPYFYLIQITKQPQ
jgi:hypothetical protein